MLILEKFESLSARCTQTAMISINGKSYFANQKDVIDGAYGRYSSIMPKYEAHILEKYLRSFHYRSTGQWTLPGMKIPYPVNLETGKRLIKP